MIKTKPEIPTVISEQGVCFSFVSRKPMWRDPGSLWGYIDFEISFRRYCEPIHHRAAHIINSWQTALSRSNDTTLGFNGSPNLLLGPMQGVAIDSSEICLCQCHKLRNPRSYGLRAILSPLVGLLIEDLFLFVSI